MLLVEQNFTENFGTLDRFGFGVTTEQSELALEHFIEHALPQFGDYQDAMLRDSHYLYHSVLSQYMNVGLLDPIAVCRRAERSIVALGAKSIPPQVVEYMNRLSDLLFVLARVTNHRGQVLEREW